MSDIRKYINLIESYERIDESFKTAKEKFSEVHDNEQEVNEYIEKFKELAKRNMIKGQDKDIGKWIKAGWESFKEMVDVNSLKTSKRTIINQNKKDAIVIYETDDSKAIVPLTRESSIIYGKNTKWCTAASDNNMFSEYFNNRDIVLIYVFTKHGKFALVTNNDFVESPQIFNEMDIKITLNEFEKITDLSGNMLVELASRHKNIIMKYQSREQFLTEFMDALMSGELSRTQREHLSRITYETLYPYFVAKPEYVIRFIEVFGKYDGQYEFMLLRDPKNALDYAKRISGESKAVEKALLNHPDYMYAYLHDVVPDKHYKVDYLKNSPKNLYLYAKNVLNDRFESVHGYEQAIVEDGNYVNEYVEHVVKFSDDYSKPFVLEYMKEYGSEMELRKAYDAAIKDSPTGDEILNMFLMVDGEEESSPDDIIQSLEQQNYIVDEQFEQYIRNKYA